MAESKCATLRIDDFPLGRRQHGRGRAEEMYVLSYLSAVDLVEDISERLGDLPAPSEDFVPTWDDVVSLVDVTHQLDAVLALLARKEGR